MQPSANTSRDGATQQTPEDVVRTMLKAAETGDVAAFEACWAEDAIWDNIPIPAVKGRREIVAKWQGLLKKPGSFRVEYRNLFSQGDVVFTERLDYITVGKLKIEAPVAGVFEVKDGQITHNREYWDLLSGTASMLRRSLFGG